MTSLADRWHDALRTARTLDPARIGAAITTNADNGLRAARYDAQGGRTSFAPCDDPRCDEGPDDHSHVVHPDPTGNAAVSGHIGDSTTDLLHLDRAALAFIDAANVVLEFVKGEQAHTWAGIVRIDAQLMPGSVTAGLDIDDDYLLPPAIEAAAKAVETVNALARFHMPREPNEDERHWTAGLADEDCCAWHLDTEPRGRHRRPRAGGTNCCAECLQVAEWAGRRPPAWFMEALIDRDAKPKAYERALSRLADELDVPAHRRSG